MSENTTPQTGSALVSLAWLAVVIGVVGNAVASFSPHAEAIQVGLSALTAVGIITLVTNWLRRR